MAASKEGSAPQLLLHQFHAAILGTTLFRIVGCYGSAWAVSQSVQPGGSHTVFGRQYRGNRIRSPFRKFQVQIERPLIIRMPYYVEIKLRVLLQQVRDFLERSIRFRLHLGLARVEVDAVDRRMAGAANVSTKGFGVH